VGGWADGRVLILSRAGGDLPGAFPEIVAAAADPPDDTALYGVM
jgi:ATP-dependent DNA ligase